MKRANGTGTIYKRRDVKRRKPYCVYLNNGHDDEGKRRRVFLGSYTTFKAAQEALEKYNQGLLVKPTEKTSLQDIWELYKEDKEALTGHALSPNYVSAWKLYIAPRLASTPIANIKTLHMQACINACKSKTTQKFIKAILGGIYSYALANDLVLKDYSSALKTTPIEKNKSHKPFTTPEMRWLWEHADQDVYKIILIQIYTGMRKSELSEILVSNVNLQKQYVIGGKKTTAGRNRIIPIANCILSFVRYFYTISRFAGCSYLIMPDKTRNIGSQKGSANIGAIYRNFCQQHSSHDARHTFITLCSNYNLPESTVKKIVGHAGSDITEAIYTHKSNEQLLTVVNRLPFGRDMSIAPEESGSHVVAT